MLLLLLKLIDLLSEALKFRVAIVFLGILLDPTVDMFRGEKQYF